MVSFFGLKFGSDRKKSLAKSGGRKGQDAWKTTEPPELARGQFYGTSQPQEHLARPGTSYSTKGPANWRQTFKGFGANSSMVDLSRAMRKESVSSLRYQSSEADFRSPAMSSSTTRLPLPSALGGSGPRVGTPDRPSTASGHPKEWVNPLDVHFCKNTIGVPAPSSVPADGPVKSPLAMQFGVNDDEDEVVKPSSPPKDNMLPVKEMTFTHGYPSPPQSVNNAEQILSPSVSDFSASGRPHGDPASLPSPATTAPRTSEDRWEAPVIRNVLAKRDTTTFHSPRRRSFTMDLEQQELEKLRKQRQTEGFAGSFADFDFGEIITKQASIEQFPEPPSTIYAASPELESFPTFVKDKTFTPKLEKTLTHSTQTASKRPEPELDTFQTDATARTMNNSPELMANFFQLPPPAPVPAPRIIAARPATLYGSIGGAPAAAAGAHPGNSFLSNFEPPPRLGFRARLGSDASSRRKTGPPRPLKTSVSQPSLRHKSVLPTAHHDEPSPKSEFAPPLNGTNEYPITETSKQSLDMKSPKSSYNPLALEGDFPVTKGLPRGRQPPRRPARSDEAPSPELPDFSLPDWDLINSAEPRHSAMPPPLATNSRPRPSISSTIDMNLPSPSFASLELSISNSGESLTQAFEDALEKTALSPGLVGDFFDVDTNCTSPTGTTTRIEAKKAPPRPAPVTLPPSPKRSIEPRSPPPAQSEFGNTFI